MKPDAARQVLEQTRAELLERIARTHKHIHDREEISANFSEQSVERSDDEVVMHLDADARDELALIDDALERIAKDEYGICLGCGEAIATERLQAIPWAQRCIRCESKGGS